MSQTFAIQPAEHEDRARLRGCHNCEAHFAGRCRRGAPGIHGWPEVAPTDVCLLWAWWREPRVLWGSALAPAEKPGHPNYLPSPYQKTEEVPF